MSGLPIKPISSSSGSQDRGVEGRSVVLIAALMLGSVALPSGVPASGDEPEKGKTVVETADGAAELAEVGPRALSRAFRQAARQATPSVVTILTYGQQRGMFSPPRPETEPQDETDQDPEQGDESSEEDSDQPNDSQPDAKQLTGIGSGVIVSADGMVITNNHVITGAKRVVVQLADDTELEATDVLGDPDSDVAMLRIERDEPFQAAGIADSEQLEIGDWVLTIGSPFRLEATVSAGIISAKNRKLQRIARGRLIQTDAAINPGNSGGPVVDLDGRVVAISTAIATRNGGYQGIGFAIPINHAKWVADELAEHRKVRRAAIGTTLVELTPGVANKVNLPPYLGVLVYQIVKGSAADRAGFKQLDVIMEFAGEPVRDPGQLREVIERKPVGSTQEVKVYRKGDEITLQVELDEAG